MILEAIRSAWGVVDTCIAITTSNLNAYRKTIQSLNFSLVTLTSIEIVVATAQKNCIFPKLKKG